ncbi:MAG TPA: DMT family transporter [Thermoleophilaceae bacterium]
MARDRRQALIALAAAGIGWGLTIPFSKVALAWLGPLSLGVARFAIAAPVLALAGRRGLRGALSWRVIGWGALFYGGVVGLQNTGIALTSVTHAALIIGAVPALVALATLARGEGRSGRVEWTGFAAAIAGAGLVAGSGGTASTGGDALMLASAALSALFVAAQPAVLRGRDPVAVTAVQMAVGVIVTLPFALAFEGVPRTLPSGDVLTAFAALVLVGSLLPFALYAYGQARVAAEVAGAFLNLETVVGAAVGAVAFGDPFSRSQLLGAAAIVGGLLLSVAPARGRAADSGDLHLEPNAFAPTASGNSPAARKPVEDDESVPTAACDARARLPRRVKARAGVPDLHPHALRCNAEC